MPIGKFSAESVLYKHAQLKETHNGLQLHIGRALRIKKSLCNSPEIPTVEGLQYVFIYISLPSYLSL